MEPSFFFFLPFFSVFLGVFLVLRLLLSADFSVSKELEF